MLLPVERHTYSSCLHAKVQWLKGAGDNNYCKFAWPPRTWKYRLRWIIDYCGGTSHSFHLGFIFGDIKYIYIFWKPSVASEINVCNWIWVCNFTSNLYHLCADLVVISSLLANKLNNPKLKWHAIKTVFSPQIYLCFGLRCELALLPHPWPVSRALGIFKKVKSGY